MIANQEDSDLKVGSLNLIDHSLALALSLSLTTFLCVSVSTVFQEYLKQEDSQRILCYGCYR